MNTYKCLTFEEFRENHFGNNFFVLFDYHCRGGPTHRSYHHFIRQFQEEHPDLFGRVQGQVTIAMRLLDLRNTYSGLYDAVYSCAHDLYEAYLVARDYVERGGLLFS